MQMDDDANRWAVGAIRRVPVPIDVAGLSREQLSRRALAICAAATQTGATMKAADHLAQIKQALAACRST